MCIIEEVEMDAEMDLGVYRFEVSVFMLRRRVFLRIELYFYWFRI